MVEVKAVLYFSSVHILVETRTVNFFRNLPRSDSSDVSFTTMNDLSVTGQKQNVLEKYGEIKTEQDFRPDLFLS